MAKFCAFCGKQIPDEAKFCAYCGASFVNTQTEAQQEIHEPVNTEPVSAEREQVQSAKKQANGYREQYRDTDTNWESNKKRKRKANKNALLILLVCALTVAMVLVGGFVWPGFFRSDTAPDATANSQPSNQQNETAFVPPVSTEPATTERPNPFMDISKDNQFYDSCLWALDKGILQEDTVEAENAITRADTLIFLWRAMGSPEPADTECPFSDVNAEDNFYKPVLWGLENGIISSSKDTFNPDKEASRSEAVAMLYNAAGGQSVDRDPVFLDTATGSWYTKSVTWASVNGILDPDNSYRFHPKGSIERGRFLLWLFRTVEPDLAPDLIPAKQESFRKLGIVTTLTAGGTTTFVTSSKENPNRQTRLSVTSQTYEVFTERENYSARQGYEWRVATFFVNGPKSEIEGNHYEFLATYQDANNVRLFWQEQSANETGNISSWVVGEDGKLVDVIVKPVERIDSSDAVCYLTVAIQVPKDYDGVCFCLCDASKAWSEDECLADVYTGKEEFVIFRMD